MQGRLPIPGPLTLGDLLDRAFRLYRARFGPLILSAAIFLVPYGLLAGLLLGTWTGSYWEALAQVASETSGESVDALGAIFSYLGLVLLVGGIGLAANGMATLVLTDQVDCALHGEPRSLGASILCAWRRLWALIRLQIVRALAYVVAGSLASTPVMCMAFVAGVAGVGLAALAGGQSLEDSPLVAGGLMLMLLCGYALAILVILLPVLYLAARWLAAVPGLVAQDWGPVEALRGSWRLSKGRAWRCIGYAVLLGLLSFLVTSLPAALIQWILMLAVPSPLMALGTGVSSAIGAVFGVIWQPLYSAALVLFYYDLRVRQEGYDLALRLVWLEAEVSGAEPGRRLEAEA